MFIFVLAVYTSIVCLPDLIVTTVLCTNLNHSKNPLNIRFLVLKVLEVCWRFAGRLRNSRQWWREGFLLLGFWFQSTVTIDIEKTPRERGTFSSNRLYRFNPSEEGNITRRGVNSACLAFNLFQPSATGRDGTRWQSGRSS